MKPKNKTATRSALIHFLPQDKEALDVLQDRAGKIARQVITNLQKTSEDAYICFRLGAREQYGLPYSHAKEVMHNLSPTPLPHAPEFIAGVINRRGALLAVLDLKRLFHIQAPETASPYIVILTGNQMTVGVLADSIEGSRAYDPGNLDAPLPTEGLIKPEYILGLHQAQTALLNVDAILSDLQSQLKSLM